VQHADITNANVPRRNGIEQWTKRGGIAGRGVLIDYYSWAQSQGIAYSPGLDRHCISEKDLEAAAAAQGTVFKRGDILLIRSGYVKWHNEAPSEDRQKGTELAKHWTGLEGTPSSIEWLWNHHFSAVAGDACVFEAWPAKDEKYRLHDNLISMWGTPVGEMFDLERLAETCKALNKWSFLFTSAPLNVVGGIASPPNAICIL